MATDTLVAERLNPNKTQQYALVPTRWTQTHLRSTTSPVNTLEHRCITMFISVALFICEISENARLITIVFEVGQETSCPERMDLNKTRMNYWIYRV